MFLAFVDFDSKDEEVTKQSHQAVITLKHLQHKFGQAYEFFYVNNTADREKRELLGITWDDVPAFAFNTLDRTILPYPAHMS